ncbi:hydroxyethylthiazole kinase [Oceanobacillus polygoni]|uniref:Hydroxyethylthiazole kinase n=1 Tax=Oceanobacillus polygoni TaxID=1235259 RepID=A0A9X1CCA5_9BACI|nr:hydroxyethylthiazole kinase [Oceanobacillus polygoni]MBP2078564.1 hydroxyethylthiazole kinase [Oceanobacillus polygoni]
MGVIAKIKEDKPFIFNITNEVASNFAANGLIAIGASPAMSHTPREAKDYGEIADAVVLNLGTLTEDRGEAMLKAGKAANENGIPVILDPIAVGGTDFRTNIINEILTTVKLAAIRANAGEIAVLAGTLDEAKGPDSIIQENDPEIAKTVAKKYDTVVISTGEVDVVTDGERIALCKNGHEMLQNITASGCLLSSFVGPFVSVVDDFYEAGIYAVTSYGIAAELAMEKAAGPGTFIPALLDALYFLTDEKVEKYKQVQEL